MGVLALLFVFISGMICAVTGRRLAGDEQRREFGVALLAAIAVATVTSATFDSLSFPIFIGLFFIILGCAGAYSGIMTAEVGGLHSRGHPSSLP